MPSEHEFLKQRLQLVRERLANPDHEFTYAGKGRVRHLSQPSKYRDTPAHREARLLRKLLAQTREGQVLSVLKSWRHQLGKFLAEHHRRTLQIQQAYDEWLRLPPLKRKAMPQPPKPPLARFKDKSGYSWIIDDRFLNLLDDLIERLQRWLDEDKVKTMSADDLKS
jgi:hypothetical protein